MYLHTYHHVNIGNHIPSWQTFKPLTPIKINLIFSAFFKNLDFKEKNIFPNWGPMAHILHAGGPWKLESPCRSQETGVNMAARQANKVPGGQWGPRVVGSRVSLTAWAPKQTNTSS